MSKSLVTSHKGPRGVHRLLESPVPEGFGRGLVVELEANKPCPHEPRLASAPRRVRGMPVFPSPVDLVDEAQGAVKTDLAPLLGRAYDDRAATAFERAREDLREQPACDAQSSTRHARREVVDEAILSLVEDQNRGRLTPTLASRKRPWPPISALRRVKRRLSSSPEGSASLPEKPFLSVLMASSMVPSFTASTLRSSGSDARSGIPPVWARNTSATSGAHPLSRRTGLRRSSSSLSSTWKVISSSPEYSLRSRRNLGTSSSGRCLTVALTRPVSSWRW